MLRLIGMVFVAIASLILAANGFDIFTWQWWTIMGLTIVGCYLTNFEIEFEE
jgi:hypothetical protein